jgi:hypothetical protein
MSERNPPMKFMIALVILILMAGAGVVRSASARAAAKVHLARADSTGRVADSLGLRVAVLEADVQARDSATAQREVAFALERDQQLRAFASLEARAARQRVQINTMLTELTPEVRELIQPVLDGFERQAELADSLTAVALERAEAAEARADSLLLWGQGWKDLSGAKDERIAVLEEQVGSLEAGAQLLLDAADHGLWILPEPEWWMVAVAAAAGYVANN